GEITPNTARVKVGIYGSWSDSVDQGLLYLKDWVQHEPLHFTFALAGLAAVAGFARRLEHLALALGLALYAGYVVFVGGDYMRGRFWLPFFFGASLSGFVSLAAICKPGHAAAGIPALSGITACTMAVLLFMYAAPPLTD